MSGRADVLVIGAGANGLTAAARLAKHGRRVVVLESRDEIGGLAAAEEFHPGFRSGGVLHDTTGLRPWVVEDLELPAHGLRLRQQAPTIVARGSSGAGLSLPGERAAAAAAIEAFSPGDGDAYRRYGELLDRVAEVLRPFLDEPPLDLVHPESMGAWDLIKRGLRLRRQGAGPMMELLRLPAVPVADFLGEWFRSDLLKAALAMPAVAGTWTGPRSPGGTLNLLLGAVAAGPGVEGGAPALVDALAACARAHGAEIRTAAPVREILVTDGRVAGVRLRSGEEIAAPAVAASCHPARVLLDLLPPGAVSHRVQQRIEHYRSRGTTAQVLLALDAPPDLAGTDEAAEVVRIAPDLDALERAFDAVKYRRFSERPALEVHLASKADVSRAPAGKGTLSVLVHFAPYALEPAWDDEQREILGDRVVAILEEQVPGLSGRVLAGRVHSPLDLENRYGLPGGHIHHGEHSLDQRLVRPLPECARYATPLPGLWLCGAGSHPGGGLTCGPGALAASAILGG